MLTAPGKYARIRLNNNREGKMRKLRNKQGRHNVVDHSVLCKLSWKRVGQALRLFVETVDCCPKTQTWSEDGGSSLTCCASVRSGCF